MAKQIKDESSIKLMTEGDEEGTKELIKAMGQLKVNENAKVIFHFSNFIGYGYDFSQTIEGIPAQKIYANAVKTTQELDGHSNFEKLLGAGVDNNFGWYLTSL